jgi:hypothetical protein
MAGANKRQRHNARIATLGGKARAAKLGKAGLSAAMTKAVNARWAKVRAAQQQQQESQTAEAAA